MGGSLSKWRYDDPAWRSVRDEVLVRDGGKCRIRGKGCSLVATEVDHIVPIGAGGAVYDPANLRASCRKCNASRAARSKHREGWRRSRTRVVLVVGPPGAGKSTLVEERVGPRDVVVDYDAIARSLGSAVSHGHEHHEVVSAARNAVLRRIQRGEVEAPRAWIVSSNPRAEAQFPHHEVVVVDPGREETLRRVEEAGRPAEWSRLVDEWYSKRNAETAGPSREW